LDAEHDVHAASFHFVTELPRQSWIFLKVVSSRVPFGDGVRDILELRAGHIGAVERRLDGRMF
jgi:hypothetical protein